MFSLKSVTTRSTTQRAIIIHGYSATPSDHWFEWLAAALETNGTTAVTPALPEPDAPDAAEWDVAVADAVGVPDQGTVIVAHSLGCLAVLRHLVARQDAWRLGSLVLVSGFLEPLPALPQLDAFISGSSRISGIAERVDRLTVVRSDDDAYVPPGHTDRLAAKLGVTAHVLNGRGHFLADDGVTSLPEILSFVSTNSSA